jgi:hypothetical protein
MPAMQAKLLFDVAGIRSPRSVASGHLAGLPRMHGLIFNSRNGFDSSNRRRIAILSCNRKSSQLASCFSSVSVRQDHAGQALDSPFLESEIDRLLCGAATDRYDDQR